MPSPVTVSSVTNVSTESGNGSQRHIVYAPNSAKWWAFYLDSGNTTQLLSAYSSDLTSWTAGTAKTLAHAPPTDGRLFSVAVASISSTDVIHITIDETGNGTYHVRATVSGTTITWGTDVLSSFSFQNTNNGVSVGIATDGHIYDQNILSGNPNVYQSTNTDSGTSWTTGMTTHNSWFNTGSGALSTAVIPLGSGNVLLISDNGANASTWTNLEWLVYSGGTPGTAAAVFGSALSGQDAADWAWAKVSNTDVHIVARSGSNTFSHVRYNGTSWSAGDSIGTLSTNSAGGLAMASDGTHVWLFAIGSASGNDISVNKWTSGTGWGGWTAFGLSSAVRTKLGGEGGVNSLKTAVYWTEGSASPYSLMSYAYATSQALSRSASMSVASSMTLSSPQHRSVNLNVASAMTVSTPKHGRAATLNVASALTAKRTYGAHRSDSLNVASAFTATRVRGVPRSVSLSVHPEFTVLTHYTRGRAAHINVLSAFTAKRTAAYQRKPAINIAVHLDATGTAIKSRTGHLSVSSAFTANLLNNYRRLMLINVTPALSATALVNLGPTPAGALRSFLPVHVLYGDQLIFSGWITQMAAQSLSPNLTVVEITAQSLYFLAQTAIPAEVLEGLPIGAALQFLTAYGLPGATVADVAAGPEQLYAAYETSGLDSIIRDLLAGGVSENAEGVFGFDEQMGTDLVFAPNFAQAPVTLDDRNPVTGLYP